MSSRNRNGGLKCGPPFCRCLRLRDRIVRSVGAAFLWWVLECLRGWRHSWRGQTRQRPREDRGLTAWPLLFASISPLPRNVFHPLIGARSLYPTHLVLSSEILQHEYLTVKKPRPPRIQGNSPETEKSDGLVSGDDWVLVPPVAGSAAQPFRIGVGTFHIADIHAPGPAGRVIHTGTLPCQVSTPRPHGIHREIDLIHTRKCIIRRLFCCSHRKRGIDYA